MPTMSSRPTLTIAFLEDKPASAAEVLQELEAPDAAALLEIVPVRVSAPVLVRMIPWSAARCLERLTPARAAAACRELGLQDMTSLLRLVGGTHRGVLLDALPVSLAKRVRNALRYPLSQVGACTDSGVPVLRDTDTAAGALKLLRESAVVASHVFVESAKDGRFLGSASTRDLLGCRPGARIAAVLVREIRPISDIASLESVNFDARWDDHLFLPVVDRRASLLGGLSRSALRRGLHEHHARAHPGARSALVNLLSAFGVAIGGLVELGLSRMSPSDSSSGREISRAR
jgi:Mg/Co/Ni transporter MgtE